MSSRPPSDPLRVAVVDDHELVVRGLAAMLADEDSVRVVQLDGTCPPTQRVDVALYDAYSGGGLCNRRPEELLLNPQVGRLMLYVWGASGEMVAEARRQGFAGVLAKSDPAPTLVAAIHRAHAGEFVVSDALNGCPGGGADGDDWPGRSQGLTAREAEVVGFITEGLSNQEIAERMHVSINSIKSFIRSAYRTMGVRTRSQAVLWGVDNGLAPQRLRVSADDTGSLLP